MLEGWRRQITREVTRIRTDARATILWSLRVTVAATFSYVAGTLFFPGSQPLLAPLTAMLVVQVTPVSLLSAGLDRVIAVVAGVSLAIAFATVVPLEWWSLGLLILVAITVGQVLRLRNNLVEVAISGMLVLGVGALGAEAAAWQRIAETLIGAGVGILSNLVFPPKVATADAGKAIDGLADELSSLLRTAAEKLNAAATDPAGLPSTTRGWLGEARRITHDIPQIGALLLMAEEGRRLNVRAAATHDVGPGLRQGLEALEHAAVAIRSLFRAVSDAAADGVWLEDDRGPDILQGLAQAFTEMADGVDAFGQLVREEADPNTRLTTGDLEDLMTALDGLHEGRTRVEDMLAYDTRPQLVELHAAVLATIKRLLAEMDLDDRVRRQVRLLRPALWARTQRHGAGPPSGNEPPLVRPEDETQVLPVVPRRRRP